MKLIFSLLVFCLPYSSFGFFYPTSYIESQKEFLKLSESFSDLPGRELYHLRIPTKTDADLYMDGLYLPQQSDNKERLVIITSGIHGVEAFTGAAIQMKFLNEKFNREMLKDTGFLIVHAVNPYGFHFLRRVSEQNIDLNRNVSGDEKLFSRFSQAYQDFESFLNPQKQVKTGFFHDSLLFIKTLVKLLTHGKKQLTQISVGGQYQNPKGIYFGGKELEPNAYSLQFMFSKAGKDYSKILHIDLHTGYGKRGTLHFFSSKEAAALPGFSDVFTGFPIDTGSDKDFYETSGNFDRLTLQVFHDKKIVIPMTFEFGTMDSQTTMGGFRSLRNLIYENQGFQNGYASSQDEEIAKKNFLDMFNPPDPIWREKVLTEGPETLSTVVERFSKI